MGFSPFSHSPKSTVPCLQNGVKNSGLQSIPQQVTSNSVFLLLRSPSCHPPTHPATLVPTLLTPRYIPSVVCPCVCVWGGGGGERGGGGGCEEYNTMLVYYFLSFHLYIFVDLVKSGMLTLVDEIGRYRNDRYYYLFVIKQKKTKNKKQFLCAK